MCYTGLYKLPGITREIFGLETQFKYFWKAEICSYLADEKYPDVGLSH